MELQNSKCIPSKRRGINKKFIGEQSIPTLFSEPLFKQSITESKISILHNDPMFSELLEDLKNEILKHHAIHDVLK